MDFLKKFKENISLTKWHKCFEQCPAQTGLGFVVNKIKAKHRHYRNGPDFPNIDWNEISFWKKFFSRSKEKDFEFDSIK